MGFMKKGRPEGYGLMLMRKGIRYEGLFSNGVMNGHGSLTTFQFQEKEFFFVGELSQGKPEGQGQFGTENKTKFKGAFREGLREGPFAIEQEGITACGEYKADQKKREFVFTMGGIEVRKKPIAKPLHSNSENWSFQ